MTKSDNTPWWVPSGLSILLLIGFALGPQIFSPTRVVQGETGTFDLSQIEFSDNATVNLTGKWLGVVGELLLSEQAVGEDLPLPGEYSPSDASLLTAWATIKVNPNSPPTGLYLPGVNTSQRVFVAVDGAEPVMLVEVGVVSERNAQSIPSYYRTIVELPRAKDTLKLYLHVANQYYPRLSIWSAPVVGSYEYLTALRLGRLLLDAMLIGVFIFLALYFIRFYYVRQSSIALLSFGFTCLLIGLRTFSSGPAADFFLPNSTMSDFNFRWRLDYIGIVLTVPLYALHLAFTFELKWFRKLALWAISVALAALVGVLVSSPAGFAQLLRPLEALLVTVALGAVIVTIDSSRRGHPAAREYLWINICLVLATIHDIVLSFNVFSSIMISHYVFSGVLILLGNQLAYQFMSALTTAEDLSRTLQKRVDEQTEVLKRRAQESEALREQAESGLASLTKLAEQRMHFFQTMSHELRTPLTLLLGPLERAHNQYPQSLEVIAAQKNAKRLLRLVNELLEFHQVQSGTRLTVRPSRLHWVTDGCIEQFQMVAELRQIKFRVEERDDALLSWVRIDPDILDKIVTNLLSNAFKYLGDVDSGSEVIVMAEKMGARIRLSVIDNGIGMSADELSRVFSPFRRGNHSLTRDVVGTGLGLSIAKTLTELMGGRIGVVSMPESGTTFWLEFDEIIPPARSIMAERSVSMLTRRAGINAALETILDDRPDIQVYRNEIRETSMMIVLDWEALSSGDKRELSELCEEDVGPPFVIVASLEHREELSSIPDHRIWCVVQEPVAQGELVNIFEECLFEQRDYHSLAAREVVEYRNYYLTEQLEKSLKLELDEKKEPQEGIDGTRGRILVVDDHEDIRQFICRILENEGYVATQAQSTKEGIRKASQGVPDLVITDWMMGDLSGLDLIREMRQREETEGIPVILLTSRGDAESKAIGFESGADAYLTKPFVDSELKALVRNLLHLRQTERERGTHVRNQVMESVSIEVSARVERALEQLRHVSRAIRDRVDVGRRLIASDDIDDSTISGLEVMLDNVHRSTFEIVGALDRVTRISEQLEHLSGRHSAPKQLVWIPGLLDEVQRRLGSDEGEGQKLDLDLRYYGDKDRSLYLQRTLFEICLERLLSLFKEIQEVSEGSTQIAVGVEFETFGAGSLSLEVEGAEELYESLNIAFGGYAPTAGHLLDPVVLREALVGASWLEDAMHHQEFFYRNGRICFKVHCLAQEFEEELEPGADLFLDLDHRPDAEVVDLQARRRGRSNS